MALHIDEAIIDSGMQHRLRHERGKARQVFGQLLRAPAVDLLPGTSRGEYKLGITRYRRKFDALSEHLVRIIGMRLTTFQPSMHEHVEYPPFQLATDPERGAILPSLYTLSEMEMLVLLWSTRLMAVLQSLDRRGQPLNIGDVGTGAGTLLKILLHLEECASAGDGVSLKRSEEKLAEVLRKSFDDKNVNIKLGDLFGTDINGVAIALARKNLAPYGTDGKPRVELIEGSFLDTIEGMIDLVIANMSQAVFPKNIEGLTQDGLRAAYDGGEGGAERICGLIAACSEKQVGHILFTCSSLVDYEMVRTIADEAGYDLFELGSKFAALNPIYAQLAYEPWNPESGITKAAHQALCKVRYQRFLLDLDCERYAEPILYGMQYVPLSEEAKEFLECVERWNYTVRNKDSFVCRSDYKEALAKLRVKMQAYNSALQRDFQNPEQIVCEKIKVIMAVRRVKPREGKA